MAIIIVNFNGWQDTIECLESVLRSTYPNFSVILVDNASSDNSLSMIRLWAEDKVDVWVDPDNFARDFSWPPVKKPICLYECGYPFEKIEKLEDVEEKELNSHSSNAAVTLIVSHQNLGYAGGVNIGLRYGLRNSNIKYFWKIFCIH